MLSIDCIEKIDVLLSALVMAANGKQRQYVQAGAAMVTPQVEALIVLLAKQDDRSVAYVIRQLIEESPRIRAALRKKKSKK